MIFVIACSETKVTGPELAVDKYVSRQHRAVNEALTDLYAAGHFVYVLSAEYGLLPSFRLIPDYNRKMTVHRAAELMTQIVEELEEILEDEGARSIVVYGGKEYRDAMKAAATLVGIDTVVELIGQNRGCGDHFSELQNFIRATRAA